MNNFFAILQSLLNEFRGYLITLLVIATVVRVIFCAVKYQNSSDDERPGVIKSARNTIFIMIGTYGLIELVSYLSTKF